LGGIVGQGYLTLFLVDFFRAAPKFRTFFPKNKIITAPVASNGEVESRDFDKLETRFGRIYERSQSDAPQERREFDDLEARGNLPSTASGIMARSPGLPGGEPVKNGLEKGAQTLKRVAELCRCCIQEGQETQGQGQEGQEETGVSR